MKLLPVKPFEVDFEPYLPWKYLTLVPPWLGQILPEFCWLSAAYLDRPAADLLRRQWHVGLRRLLFRRLLEHWVSKNCKFFGRQNFTQTLIFLSFSSIINCIFWLIAASSLSFFWAMFSIIAFRSAIFSSRCLRAVLYCARRSSDPMFEVVVSSLSRSTSAWAAFS